MDPWLKHATSVLDLADAQESYPPFKHKALTRWTASLCMPIYCAPCVLWSCLGRIVACPVNGIANICTPNACTVCTDSSIRAYADLTQKHAKLKKLPLHAEDEYTERFLVVISRIERIFLDTQDIRKKYAIAEAFVAPIIGQEVMPSQVLFELRKVRLRVFSVTLSKQHASSKDDGTTVKEDKDKACGAVEEPGYHAADAA